MTDHMTRVITVKQVNSKTQQSQLTDVAVYSTVNAHLF